MKLLLISGSLRKESFNTKLIHETKRIAEEMHKDVEFTIANIDLPLFNQDIADVAFPQSVTTFKDQIAAADGIIISTPEYNRSVPGVLKNAIDWSGLYNGNRWQGKKVALMGATPTITGTALSQYEIRRILYFLGSDIMRQPEMFIPNAQTAFDMNGRISAAEGQYLKSFLEAFFQYIG